MTEPKRLLDIEIQLAADRQKVLAEIESVQSAAVASRLAAMLEANAPGLKSLGAEGLREQLHIIDALTTGVRAKRREALKESCDSHAADLRSRATSLEHEAARVRQRAREVLDKLAELLEVPLDLSATVCQRKAGEWMPLYGKDLENCLPHEAVPNRGLAEYETPRHAKLEAEATELRRRADVEASRMIQESGEEEAATVGEFLTKLENEPETIWPSITEIEQWAEAVTAKARQSYGATFDVQPVKLRLAWKNGEIDRENSILQTFQSHFVPGNHGPGFNATRVARTFTEAA